MICCHQIEGVSGELCDIDVDHNHDGFVYIKQSPHPNAPQGTPDDWVIVDAQMLDELIKALVDVQSKGYFLDD